MSQAAPSPPTWDLVVTGWDFDVLLGAVVLAGGAYALGVRRLARRGRTWPRVRSLAFAAGLAIILVATQSGLAAYDDVLFSLHVVQHLALGMVAPLLLVSGAPVTLALQAGGRPTQRRLLRVLHSRAAAVVTHPATAWLLFGGTLVALYFTGLYELSLRHDGVHVATHVHFVVAGCLFMAHVVGIDPIAGALGYGARLLYVLVALPFHAFLGVAILGSDRVLAADWYRTVDRSWGASALADQRTGAGVLWVAGEMFGVVTALIIVRRWMAQEERAGARHDRRLDRGDIEAVREPSATFAGPWKSASASSSRPRS